MLVTQSCPSLCNPMDCSPPSSSVHEIFQTRILEWIAIFFYRGSSQPKDWTQISCTTGIFFTVWATRDGVYLRMRSNWTKSPVWDIITLICWSDKQLEILGKYSRIFNFEIQGDIRARDINMEWPGYRYFGKLRNLDFITKIWDRQRREEE